MKIAASLLAALLALTGAATQSAASDSVAASLVGSWRLVSFEDRPPAGPSLFPYGATPKGLLVYDSTGHMAVQIMKNPHPGVGSGDEEQVTPAEKAALVDAYVAYFGRYRVDAKRGVVIHQVEGDLYDVYIGRDEERPFELDGDRLTLKPAWVAKGVKWVGIRVFERIRPVTGP